MFQTVSQSVISRSRPALTPHRLAVRLRHSRSNTSTEYSLPGATQLSQVRSISPSGQGVPCRICFVTKRSGLGPPRKKTPGGAGTTHGTHGRTRAHGHTDHTREERHKVTSIQTHQHARSTARPRDDRIRGQLNSRIPGAEFSPRRTQKRPPPANPTRPPPAPIERAPPPARLLVARRGGVGEQCTGNS